MSDQEQGTRKSLRQAGEDVRREVRQSPEWLREIYDRNRRVEQEERAQRERPSETRR